MPEILWKKYVPLSGNKLTLSSTKNKIVSLDHFVLIVHIRSRKPHFCNTNLHLPLGSWHVERPHCFLLKCKNDADTCVVWEIEFEKMIYNKDLKYDFIHSLYVTRTNSKSGTKCVRKKKRIFSKQAINAELGRYRQPGSLKKYNSQNGPPTLSW